MKRTALGLTILLALVFLFVLLPAIGCFPSSRHAQQTESFPVEPASEERFAEIGRLISRGLEERNVPSVSIAVAHKGRVVWERSVGWADREKRVKASPDTVYSLASTTKPMIATGLMKLVRAGKVELDSPVEHYIGPRHLTVYEGSAKEVTLRRLLHHTAGLPQHFNYFYADESNRPLPLEETIRRFGIIVRQPGKAFCYANLGYAMIGHIIAKVSGRSLAEYMSAEVFRPLGMTNALFDPDPTTQKRLAISYDNHGGIVPFKRSDTSGAGHAYASVRDLIRFGMFHLKDHLEYQRPILDDDTIDQMQTEKDGTIHPGGGNESYGLGWFFNETDRGARAIWHEGGWTGASVMLKLLPDEDIAVAVLMNVFDREFVNHVADEAIRVLVPNHGKPIRQQNKGAAAAPLFKLPVGRYTGKIHTLKGMIPLILDKADDGKLYARLGDPKTPPKSVFILPAIVPRAPNQILGSFPGSIDDRDASRHPHHVFLDLRFVREELTGTASAMTLGGLPFGPPDDQRMHFHLPYHVSLRTSP